MRIQSADARQEKAASAAQRRPLKDAFDYPPSNHANPSRNSFFELPGELRCATGGETDVVKMSYFAHP